MFKLKKYLDSISFKARLDQIFVLVLGLWILHIILGLLAWLLQIESLRILWFGALSFFVLWVVPAFLSFAIKKYSYFALWFVALIYALDVWLSVYAFIISKEFVVYFLIKILVLLFVLSGFKSIKVLRSKSS